MSIEPQTQADLMKRVTRRVLEGLNDGNVDVLDETHATDCVWHGPQGQVIRGREGIKENVRGYVTAFPDMQMKVEHMVAEGNMLATHWSVVATHTGPLGEIPPTGKTVRIRGHIMARFEGGKVVEEHELFDELAMMQQLGLTDA